jgi:hypothetical protein
VSGTGREPGWYPDPWDTPEERYFDGVAWARTTRRPGGPDTPPDIDAPVPPTAMVESPSMPTSPPSTTPASAAPGAPPGWHPDPWAAAALRYWDGSQWTGHVSGMPGGQPTTARLVDEHTAGRWAKAGLAWAGPALAVSSIAGAFQWQWIADHWDDLTSSGSQTNGNSGAAIISQLSGIVLLIAGILFLIWFHRSAVLAASAGLSARRQPVLATISFLIPILNFWWPYQSTCDLLPANHPARVVVRRWWALWIACSVGGLTIIATAFMNVIALGVMTGVVVVLALLAAVAARNVVSEISDAHDQLLAGV